MHSLAAQLTLDWTDAYLIGQHRPEDSAKEEEMLRGVWVPEVRVANVRGKLEIMGGGGEGQARFADERESDGTIRRGWLQMKRRIRCTLDIALSDEARAQYAPLRCRCTSSPALCSTYTVRTCVFTFFWLFPLFCF